MKTIVISSLLLVSATGCQTPAQKFNPPAEPTSAHPADNGSLGETKRQTGGVNSVKMKSAQDVKSTAIGAYDAHFVQAVTMRWNQLWVNRMPDASGKVLLEFRLHPDGRITDMKMVQNEVTEFMENICERAILDASPYERWPREMRMEVAADYRDVQCTFYYSILGDQQDEAVSKPSTPAPSTSTSTFGSAPSPTGFRSLSWGDSPTAMLKKTASNPDGSAMYVSSDGTNPGQLFDIPVKEEAFMFSHGRFYGGMAWLDGRDNFEKMKAELVRRYGQPSFVDPRISLWKWKWQDRQIEVSLYYQERFSRTTVSFENNNY
jgi:hypothetical protein